MVEGNNIDEVFDHVIEVKLMNELSFQRVLEVLTRIGIPNYTKRELYQTAHILHKHGKYYIVHFKDMFALNGKDSTIDEEDIKRIRVIAKLLEDWGLVKIVNIYPKENNSSILVIPRSQKNEWKLIPKYQFKHRIENGSRKVE